MFKACHGDVRLLSFQCGLHIYVSYAMQTFLCQKAEVLQAEWKIFQMIQIPPQVSVQSLFPCLVLKHNKIIRHSLQKLSVIIIWCKSIFSLTIQHLYSSDNFHTLCARNQLRKTKSTVRIFFQTVKKIQSVPFERNFNLKFPSYSWSNICSIPKKS